MSCAYAVVVICRCVGTTGLGMRHMIKIRNFIKLVSPGNHFGVLPYGATDYIETLPVFLIIKIWGHDKFILQGQQLFWMEILLFINSREINITSKSGKMAAE